MVLTDALCAINLASSAMMNGMCCYYQKQEEKERNQNHEDAIRRAIREEWDRNRMFDMDERFHFQQQQQKQTGGIYYSTVVPLSPSQSERAEKRRHKLMASKGKTSGSSIGSGRAHSVYDDRRSEAATSSFSAPLPSFRNMGQPIPLSRSFVSTKEAERQRSRVIDRTMSSLIDEGDDDEDDEEDEIEIAVQGLESFEYMEDIALE